MTRSIGDVVALYVLGAVLAGTAGGGGFCAGVAIGSGDWLLLSVVIVMWAFLIWMASVLFLAVWREGL